MATIAPPATITPRMPSTIQRFFFLVIRASRLTALRYATLAGMFREVAAVTPGCAKRQRSGKSFLYRQIREMWQVET
jgi:hypothetical protein